MDLSRWKGSVSGRTRSHLVRIQTSLPRHKTTQLDHYVSRDASMVGLPAVNRVFYAANNVSDG